MTQKVLVQYTETADPAIALPSYETAQAAGADLRANFPPEARKAGLLLAPGARALVPTGLRVALPEGHEWQIRARSGLALKQGLALVNGVGTIDADYRGPVGVILINLGTGPIQISHGDRIAQAVLVPVIQACFEQSEDLAETERGTGGFGSTGVSSGDAKP